MRLDTVTKILVLPLPLLMFLSAAWAAPGLGASSSSRPDPRLSPAEAVRIQLDALRHNDTPKPDTGIGVVFRFASPSNQAQTGPLDRFKQMIRGHYADLIGHREARLMKTLFENDQAIQPVEVISKNGITFRYLFIQRRYELPQGRCWLTDSVVGKPAEALRAAAWTPGRFALK